MNPFVSVCIPTYNGQAFLRECLDSVLAQSLADFEIVVVDDCSSDSTLDIVREYAARDSRIRATRNEQNRGLVGNWERCVELARGEWIKFVFQDDVIAPRCLEKMLAAGKSGQVLVACARDFIFEPGTPPTMQRFYLKDAERIAELYRDRNPMPADSFCRAAVERIGANIVGEPTAVLLHRSVFSEYGSFNPQIINGCDIEYWYRVVAHRGLAYVPEVLASFRVHPGGTSALNDANRDFRKNILDNLLILHDIVFEPGYAPMRSAAARLDPPVDLVELFWERAYWAGAFAREAAADPVNPDTLPLTEWTKVSAQYPRLNAIPLKYHVLRKWRGLARKLTEYARNDRAAVR